MILYTRNNPGIFHFDEQPYRLSNTNGNYRFPVITGEAHACSFDELPKNNGSSKKSMAEAGDEYAKALGKKDKVEIQLTQNITSRSTGDAIRTVVGMVSRIACFKLLAVNSLIISVRVMRRAFVPPNYKVEGKLMKHDWFFVGGSGM